MFRKVLSRRAFSAQAAPKFPEGTVAGCLKASVAAQANMDVIRFNNQNINWTVKELDKYSAAFAFGLLEAGFTRGDSLVVWVDRTRAAESLIAQLGAFKSGVEIVTFDENTSADALHHALSSTGARGLLLTPNSACGEGHTRGSVLNSLCPELKNTYLGEELNLSAYPHLSQIIQTETAFMAGVNRYKDVAVYTTPTMSSYKIPENRPTDVCMRVLKGGAEHVSYTSEEIVAHAHASSRSSADITFMSTCIQRPFGLATVLGASHH